MLKGETKKKLLVVTLTICVLLAGHLFYKLNSGDLVNSIAFTVGLLGIMLSVLRNLK